MTPPVEAAAPAGARLRDMAAAGRRFYREETPAQAA